MTTGFEMVKRADMPNNPPCAQESQEIEYMHFFSQYTSFTVLPSP